MRDGPNRHSISTELLTEDILMELDKSVDAVLPGQLHRISHQLQVGLVELSLAWLNTRPHDSQANAVYAASLEELHVCFVKGSVVGRHFGHYVETVEEEFCSLVVNQSPVSDVDG